MIPSSLRLKDAINIGVGKPERFYQLSMLCSADEGIQNVIYAVSKVIGGGRESEAPKRRSAFPKRDVHDGEARSSARLEETLMRASDTGKRADYPVLHRLCRVCVGLKHTELVKRHAEFEGGHMLYLVPYDRQFQMPSYGKAAVPGYAVCIRCPHEQTIRQSPDRSAEERTESPVGRRKKTGRHLPVIARKAGQKLGELGFNKLNVINAQFTKDISRQFDIASGHGSRAIDVVERRLNEICDLHSTTTT
nr:hypothetical protein [uncultured Roseobacter sp.]